MSSHHKSEHSRVR